jgi:hypothetical protein
VTVRCPTCGQTVQRVIRDPAELLDELRDGRDVYRSVNGTWHLTRTRNMTITPEAVYELLKYGKIVRTYSNCDDCFRIGQTIDIEATMQARRRLGKKAPLVYVQ